MGATDPGIPCNSDADDATPTLAEAPPDAPDVAINGTDAEIGADAVAGAAPVDSGGGVAPDTAALPAPSAAAAAAASAAAAAAALPLSLLGAAAAALL